eukprot:CFRG4486T1
MPSLLFLPFASSAEVAFWKYVSRQKLENIRLSEEPLPLYGHYTTTSSAPSLLPLSSSEDLTTALSNASLPVQPVLSHIASGKDANQQDTIVLPPRFLLGDQAFATSTGIASGSAGKLKIDGLPSDAVPVNGTFHLVNQLDQFKNIDKQALLETEASKLWDDITSGRALSDPNLLNRVLLLAFIDLKKFLYYFWFAFPALALRFEVDQMATPLHHHRPRLFVTRLLETHVLAGMPPFFCVRDGDAVDSDVGTEENVSDQHDIRNGHVVQLSDWESVVDTKQRRLTVGFLDPSTHPLHPGWPLRNLLALLNFHTRAKVDSVDVVCLRKSVRDGVSSTDRSIVFSGLRLPAMDPDGNMEMDITNTAAHAPKQTRQTSSMITSISGMADQESVMSMPKIVGWERNVKGKLGPRVVNLTASMDPRALAESAVDLNLSLMRWRILPNLDLDIIKSTKCLLLGAGTLGCNVARCLMGWGVRHITFVDNGLVSYSNPARQSLFKFKDCIGGNVQKAQAAAKNLIEVFPGIVADGHAFSIPMPGHSVSASEEANVREDVEKLERLISDHDVVFLLMDTRESRWLPTLLGQAMGKLTLNAALGFDQYLVMRHGTQKSPDATRLGCYFCNDVVAPANSTKDRTLDQQCTVTRPGLSFIASALVTELMVSVLQHPLREKAPGDVIGKDTPLPINSQLGFIPHQTRGFLSHYNMIMPVGRAYDRCTGCSKRVVDMYNQRGFEFLLCAFNNPMYLEDITGLTEMKTQTEELDFEMDFSDSDDETLAAM